MLQKFKTMSGLIHAHSGLRYVVLALLLFAIFKAFTKKSTYTESDRKLNLFTLIATHTQILIGFVLYFMSEKVRFVGETMSDAFLRFFALEHVFGMVFAAVLITIGHSKSKKADSAEVKNKKIAVFYTIALVLILASIPWPFREALGGKWF